VEAKIVYFIDEKTEEKFLEVLRKYWQFFGKKTPTEADDIAISSYDHLIRGLDFDGNPVKNSNLVYFDDVLSELTSAFYTPTDIQRFRFKKGVRPKKKNSSRNSRKSANTNGLDGINQVEVDRIKTNLLSEYPFLDRKDLEISIENYCRLIVKISDLMTRDIVANNVAIKNLTETMIKLGGFLGIDEEKKAKQKAFEDQQSVAALSMQFQQTIDVYPAIMDRMRYEEIRILLEKYDNSSMGISKELFESPAYSGMTIAKAREFVKEREMKYEEKDA